MSESAAALSVPSIDALGQAEYARRKFGYSPGKLAMWLFLASDAMGFVGLLSSYVVLRASLPSAEWRPTSGEWGWEGNAGLPPLDPIVTGFNTFVLILSSFTMVLALDRIQRGNVKGLLTFLGLTILGGATFLGIQVYEYGHLMHQGLHMSAHPYGATFFVCTGFHGAHVLAGVIYLSCIWLRALRGAYSAESHSPVELAGLFWHFVDLVWIVLFVVIYLL